MEQKKSEIVEKKSIASASFQEKKIPKAEVLSEPILYSKKNHNLDFALWSYYSSQVIRSPVSRQPFPFLDFSHRTMPEQQEKKLTSVEEIREFKALKDGDPEIKSKQNSENHTKDLIILRNLFSNGKCFENQRILIEDGTGAVSPSLCQYIAHHRIFVSKFSNIFWIPLAQYLSYLSEGHNNHETMSARVAGFVLNQQLSTLKNSSVTISSQDIEAVLSTKKNSDTLLLLDGFEQVSEKLKDNAILQELLNFKNIIVTTNAYQIPPPEYHFDKHLFYEGLTDKQIHEFINSYFLQHDAIRDMEPPPKNNPAYFDRGIAIITQPDQLEAVLKSNPNCWELARIPLNLALFYESYRALSELLTINVGCKTVPTMTDLCHSVLMTFQKEAMKKEKKGEFNLEKLRILKPNHSQTRFALSAIAWNMMQRQQQIIEPAHWEEIVGIFILTGYYTDTNVITEVNKQAINLGFLQPYGSHKTTDLFGRSYCFINTTFQQYFAAHYMLGMLLEPEKTSKFHRDWLRQHQYEPRYAVFIGFLAGLTTRQGYNLALKAFWKELLFDETVVDKNLRLIERCLIEAKFDRRIPEIDKLLVALQSDTHRRQLDKKEHPTLTLLRHPAPKNIMHSYELHMALSSHYRRNMREFSPLSGQPLPLEYSITLTISDRSNQDQPKQRWFSAMGKMNPFMEIKGGLETKSKQNTENKINNLIELQDLFSLKNFSENGKPQRILLEDTTGTVNFSPLHYCIVDKFLSWNQFRHIFFIPLPKYLAYLSENYQGRENMPERVAAFILNHQLPKDNSFDICHKDIEVVLSAEKNWNTLLLLEGYEQVAEKLKNSAILRELFEFSNIIVTTGLGNILSSEYHFDRHLKYTGLTDQQIGKFVQNYFYQLDYIKRYLPNQKNIVTTDPKQLLKTLKQNSGCWELARIPVNLALFYEGGLCMPQSTMTGTTTSSSTTLSDQLTMASLYQNILKSFIDKGIEKGKLTSSVEKNLSLVLFSLGAIAWHGMLRQQLIIEAIHWDEIQATFALAGYTDTNIIVAANKQALNLGFLQPYGSHKTIDLFKCNYCFIDSSFQQYFAAIHMLWMLQNPEMSIWHQNWLRQHKYEPRYAIFIIFLAGLTTLRDRDVALQAFWRALLSPPHDVIGIKHLKLMERCLIEAQFDCRIPRLAQLKAEIDQGYKAQSEIKSKKTLPNEMPLFTAAPMADSKLRTYFDILNPHEKNIKYLIEQFISNPVFLKKTFNEIEDKTLNFRELLLDMLCHMMLSINIKNAMNANIRQMAIWILEGLGPNIIEKAGILSGLLVMAEDVDLNVRHTAIEVLSGLNLLFDSEEQVIARVLKAARTEVDFPAAIFGFRKLAMEGWGDRLIDNFTALHSLLTALNSENSSIQQAAIEAIKALDICAVIKKLQDINTDIELQDLSVDLKSQQITQDIPWLLQFLLRCVEYQPCLLTLEGNNLILAIEQRTQHFELAAAARISLIANLDKLRKNYGWPSISYGSDIGKELHYIEDELHAMSPPSSIGQIEAKSHAMLPQSSTGKIEAKLLTQSPTDQAERYLLKDTMKFSSLNKLLVDKKYISDSPVKRNFFWDALFDYKFVPRENKESGEVEKKIAISTDTRLHAEELQNKREPLSLETTSDIELGDLSWSRNKPGN